LPLNRSSRTESFCFSKKKKELNPFETDVVLHLEERRDSGCMHAKLIAARVFPVKQRRQGEPVTAVSGKADSCDCEVRLRASGMSPTAHGLAIACTVAAESVGHAPTTARVGVQLGSALHQTEAVCMLLLRLAGAKYHQVRMAGPTPPRVWAACVSVSTSQAGRVSHASVVTTRAPMIDATAAGQPAGQWDLPARSRRVQLSL
jgi:hypothetical protein